KLLPGVGSRTYERLEAAGIETVAQLAEADPQELERTFGPKHGRGLRARANGEGSETLTVERVRKSESRETTFPHDVTDRERLLDAVDPLAQAVGKSLTAHGRRGRTVTLKIRLRPFKTHTRSRTLPSPTCDPEEVASTARELLERFDPQTPVRLIGVGVAGLADENEPAPGPAAPTGEGGQAGPEPQLDLAS